MLKKGFFLSLMIVTIAWSLHAWGSDSKNYPGSMCVLKEAYLNEDYWITTDIGRANGTFYNEYEVTVGAVCPMLADEITYYSANVVVDNPSGATFECRLISMDLENPANIWLEYSYEYDSGVQEMSFDVSDDPSYDKPLHFMLCFVPPGGKIVRYYVYEDGGEIQ